MKLSSHVTNPHMVVAFLIHDAARICRQLVDERMRHVGLTRAQWFLLNYAYLYDGLSQQELADLIDLGKSNVAKQIRSLEEKGWLRRGPHETDGRSFRVFLPEEMKPTIAKLNKLADATMQTVLERVDDKDVPHLIRMLRSIDQQLESDKRTKIVPRKSDRLVAEINAELGVTARRRSR